MLELCHGCHLGNRRELETISRQRPHTLDLSVGPLLINSLAANPSLFLVLGCRDDSPATGLTLFVLETSNSQNPAVSHREVSS